MARAVFVFESGDVTVFASVADAIGWVEAVDVDNGEFDFFAEDGTVLLGTTTGEQVALTETDERRLDELRERLRAYLSSAAGSLDPGLADDPVAAAQAILDDAWARRPFRRFPWLDRRVNGVTPPAV